jgi:hypothetical protein
MNSLILAVAISILVSVPAGIVIGVDHERKSCEAKRVASVERAIKQAEIQSSIDGSILTEAANRNATEQAKTQKIIREVTKYVEHKRVESPPIDVGHGSCTIDTCRLCLAAEAVHGGDGSICPCGADGSVPGTKRP